MFFSTLAAAAASAANDPKLEKEVLGALEAFRVAFLKKDFAAVQKMVHDDLVFTHSNGTTENKTQFMDAYRKATDYVVYNITDTKVHASGNFATTFSKMDIRHVEAKTTPNPLLVLNVWEKTSSGWLIVARQATKPTPPAPPTK
jgi:ketosteroid isomerase-like protein